MTTTWDNNRLDFLLKQSGMTSKQLATITEMSLATVNQWRQGRLAPSLRIVMQLADLFAVPIDYLVGRCSSEMTASIEKDYAAHFKELRADAFEQYLIVGQKPDDYEDKIVAIYPYNLLEELFGEPWHTPLNPLQEKGLERALEMLTQREREYLLMYYRDEMSLDKIGNMFSRTRERVRQIIHKALRKLRHPTKAKMIRDGYDENETEKFFAKREKELAERQANLEAKQTYLDNLDKKLNGQMIELGRDPEQFDIKRTKTTLDDMQLSVRSYNCLSHAGIHTLQDILDYTGDFTNIRNLGVKSMKEIRSKVFSMTGIDIYDIQHCIH